MDTCPTQKSKKGADKPTLDTYIKTYLNKKKDAEKPRTAPAQKPKKCQSIT